MSRFLFFMTLDFVLCRYRYRYRYFTLHERSNNGHGYGKDQGKGHGDQEGKGNYGNVTVVCINERSALLKIYHVFITVKIMILSRYRPITVFKKLIDCWDLCFGGEFVNF
jgi:hypothetical protein